MAKTWNWSPATWRTQQAVSTVFPSVGVTNGLRNVARRVSPSGKSPTGPSGTHDKYPLARPRVIEDSTKRTMGTAKPRATSPLNKIPNFISRLRRVMVASGATGAAFGGESCGEFSCDILLLLALRGSGNGIRLPGVLCPLRRQPRDHVADILLRHGFAGDVAAPVRRAQFRPTSDHHSAQLLIAQQRKKRIVGNAAGFRSAPPLGAMTRGAIRLECYGAAHGIARGFRCVRRRIRAIENPRFSPI